MKIPVKQLSAMSLLVATAAAVRVGMNWVALAMIPFYGVVITIGLSETLAFTSGFVFGPIQGFITGALIIIISDLFTWAGPWTPFIAAIIGLLGVCGGVLRHFKGNPSVALLAITAVTLTLMSEILQNIWFAWFFNMPIIAVLIMGVHSIVMAVINNTVLFTVVAPRIIKVLQEWVMPKSVN